VLQQRKLLLIKENRLRQALQRRLQQTRLAPSRRLNKKIQVPQPTSNQRKQFLKSLKWLLKLLQHSNSQLNPQELLLIPKRMPQLHNSNKRKLR
jgi:hypothetical protein